MASHADAPFRDLLRDQFRPYGELSPRQLDLLEQHYQLLLKWNPRLNLTRIVDLEEVVSFHYCESLFVGTVLPPGPLAVADLGSGAGFPGIPVAILRPEIQMTLIEADVRKAVFLRESARHLPNVQVATTRFENCVDRFDWIISRAVALKGLLACRLALSFALLVSVEDAPPGVELIKLPWGHSRGLIVSRST